MADKALHGLKALPRDDLQAHARARHEHLLADDPQYRAATPIAALNAMKTDRSIRFAPMVTGLLRGYGDRPALGRRATRVAIDAATGRQMLEQQEEFETLSYRDLQSRAQALAATWSHEPAVQVRPGELVCLLGFGGFGFVVADLATIHIGAVSVPLQTNATTAQLVQILGETAPRCLASTIEQLPTAVDMIVGGHRPAQLLVLDYRDDIDAQREVYESARQRLAAAGATTRLETLEATCARGAGLAPVPAFEAAPGADPLSTIYYTSGSSGTPKGAMYGQANASFPWRGVESQSLITLNFMPLNHSFGRSLIARTLGSGGTCYFTARSDTSALFEDLVLVRPTHLNLVPRLCDMVQQRYLAELQARGTGADAEVLLAEFRQRVLGGRVLGCAFGSAPLAPELRAFIERCLDVPFNDNYGATEVVGVSVNGRVMKPPVLDYKLIDVPELGYFRSDQPHPRGELAVKTATIMQGYYKRPADTAAAFDADGYYLTGDVMVELAPDHIVYVDRRNNVQKLSQGEFVAIANVEAAFVAGDPLIRQIYLYGSSERAFLLAVIVPQATLVQRAGVALDDDAGVRALLRAALARVAAAKELQSYEVPRDFIIDWQPFTTENGLLAGIGKYRRPAFKERYAAKLEAMYAAIAATQADELQALRATGSERPIAETVARAVQATLGIDGVHCDAATSFPDLGGDSLSALSLSMLLEDIYGREVPVGVIADPAGSLAKLAAYIEQARSTGAMQPGSASVHGRGSRVARAADLKLEHFIDAEALSRAASMVPPKAQPPAMVLVTGANGYLGRFICLEWLERMAKVGGRVVCIVRGRDAVDARRRVYAAFDSGNAEPGQRFGQLAAAHLEVLAGDLAATRLGLDPADWQRLAAGIDLIVHPGAFVNHVLPYAQLFGPNVVGTAELIRLALELRLKRFANVSTIAAAMGEGGKPIDEDTDVRHGVPQRALESSGYANGYATSKWAAEVLLRDAHDRFGLPVLNFRSDMILAHSRHAGQLNVPDMFTRWIYSIVRTGIAPASFYQAAAAPGLRPHYDGLPVDFTAAAIVSLSLAEPAGYHDYHVQNLHDDGVSLDTFVDWIAASGVTVRRIDDYEDWRSRFAAALRALPEAERQQSFLPLLHQMKRPQPVATLEPAQARRFREAVRRHGAGAYRDVPGITRELIIKYLADLRLLGMHEIAR